MTPASSDVPERFQVRFEGKTLLGIYRIDRELAAGGMGSVYLAHDENLGRRVVVKVPHARFLAEPGFRARFRREVTELVRLEHPHVVRILAQGEEADVPYFVLQYLGGGSLEERIAKGPQSPESAVGWLTTVAETLDFVHAQGVVHRDVKPANILFDERGHVFLSDFGVVKALEGDASSDLTEAGAGVGSPLYMAPEQALGRGVSGRSDQYALATTLYEALAGSPPYGRGALVEMVLKKDKGEAPPLRAVAPGVPEACAVAVHRALRRNPDERFHSCGAFADAFRSALVAATTRPDGKGASPAGAQPRRSIALVLVPLLVVLVAAVGLASGWFVSTPRTGPAAGQEVPQQVLRLSSPGSEPHRALRMRPAPGVRDLLRTRMEQAFSRTLDGTEPASVRNILDQAIEARVEGAGDGGRTRLSWTFHQPTTVARLDAGAEDRIRSQAVYDRLGTTTATSILTPDGLAADVALFREGERDVAVDQFMANFEVLVHGLATSLPADAVGVGAEWVVTGFVTYFGMTYQETTTYRLVELEGNRVRLTFDKSYAADKQGVPFAKSGGEEARLQKLVGSGDGEIVLDLDHPLPRRFQSKGSLVLDAVVRGKDGKQGMLHLDKTFSLTGQRD